MSVGLVHIFSPIFGLFLSAVIQILGCRYLKTLGVLKSVFLGFVCGILCLFVIEAAFLWSANRNRMDVLGEVLVNTITYGALGYCYFHFINLGETARRIRIIRELYDSKTALSMDEILNRYSSKTVIEKRINRLLHNGQIVYRHSRYFIGNLTMIRISKIILFMKYGLLGKKSEFD